MTLRLTGVTIESSSGKPVLSDVNCTIPTNERFVVFSNTEVERQNFVAILAGSVNPAAGIVLRHARLSCPLGSIIPFRKDLSVSDAVRHAALSFGADPDALLEYVMSFPAVDVGWSSNFGALSSTLQRKVSFAVCFGIPLDTYLIDGTIAISDDIFRAACIEAFHTRCQGGYIFATNHISHIVRFADSGAIIAGGEIRLYDDAATMVRDARVV